MPLFYRTKKSMAGMVNIDFLYICDIIYTEMMKDAKASKALDSEVFMQSNQKKSSISQDWQSGMLSRLNFNPHAEETTWQTLNRVWPTWVRDMMGILLGFALILGVVGFWEGYLFPSYE